MKPVKISTVVCWVGAVALAQQADPKALPRPAVGGSVSPGARSDEEVFGICDAESFDAYFLARKYLLGGKKRELIPDLVKELGPPAQEMADLLIQQVDRGEITHYADFAAQWLFKCAAREGRPFEKPQWLVRVAFARVDIPNFLYLDKENGKTKEEAIERTSRRLKDREIYPLDLISAVAEVVYLNTTEAQKRKLLHATFWSCVYNKEWQAGPTR